MLPRISGNQFRAARDLAGLSRNALADKSGLSQDVLYSWEVSSNSIVPAQYRQLCRALDALESEGIIFDVDGIRRKRPASPSTTIGSEEARP